MSYEVLRWHHDAGRRWWEGAGEGEGKGEVGGRGTGEARSPGKVAERVMAMVMVERSRSQRQSVRRAWT